jgi:hypothetical protein
MVISTTDDCLNCLWYVERDAYRVKKKRQAFDQVMDLCRNQAMAGSSACNPVLFEPMVMSVLLGQQKMIRTLQRKIDALLLAMLPVEKAE